MVDRYPGILRFDDVEFVTSGSLVSRSSLVNIEKSALEIHAFHCDRIGECMMRTSNECYGLMNTV